MIIALVTLLMMYVSGSHNGRGKMYRLLTDLTNEVLPSPSDYFLAVQIHSQKRKAGVIAPKRFVQRLRKDNELFRGYMHQVIPASLWCVEIAYQQCHRPRESAI